MIILTHCFDQSNMACSKCDWIVGVAIIVYYATAITELVSSVPVGLVLVSKKH